MIRRTVHEWGYLPVNTDDGEQVLTRPQADQLLKAAQSAHASLRLGGSGADRILVDHRRRLRAQQVVGVLAAPGISLEILPKIDGLEEGGTRVNLIRMLVRTLDLKIAGGSLTPVGWQHYDTLEILIRLFCDRLLDAVRHGLTRQYVRHHDDLPMLRGRMDLKRQFSVLAASPQGIASRYSELSVDTPLNQILKAAVARLRVISRAPENQRRLNELEFALADITRLPARQLPWKKVALDRTNAAYHDLLVLAAAFLRGQVQLIGGDDGLGFSLLFEMNKLFEEFIGRSVRIALKNTGLQVTLQGPQSYALSEIGTSQPRFMTQPDIVIRSRGKPIMVIDTKWKRLIAPSDDPKRGVSPSDVYQMIAYAQVYRVKQLMLLYPHHSQLEQSEGLVKTYTVTGAEEVRLSIATVSLLDLQRITSQLKSLVAASSLPM